MSSIQKNSLVLSINDTQVLKGIALLLLLCHHCLFEGKGYDDIIISGLPLFQTLGVFCKLCVAIFVFLSGYGLMAQSLKSGGLGSVVQFYRRRYVKLMVNFWLVYLLFVPIGVFFFDRTFPQVYGEHYIIRAILDLFGICSTSSYIATWWFYGCIIMLYAVFPFIWKYRCYWPIFLPTTFMLSLYVHDAPFFNLIDQWLFVFACGAIFACKKTEVGGGEFCRQNGNCISIAISM